MKNPLKTKTDYAVAAVALVVLVAFTSPIIETLTDATRLDNLVTTVCHDRHGFDFVSRWSCRSTIRAHIIPITFSCAFNRDRKDKGGDVCRTADRLMRESGFNPDD